MRCVRAVIFTIITTTFGCSSAAHDGETTDVTVSLPEAPSASAPAAPPPARIPKAKPVVGRAYADCVAELRDAGSLSDEASFADYSAGIASERANKIDDARKRWLQVIQNSPKSKLVPLAYFAFGFHFQREAATGDASKWEFAVQSYQEVIKYPETSIFAVAQLELGRSNAAKGEDAKALVAYKNALGAARTKGDICGPEIIEASKADVVKSYAKIGAPERAYNFLRVHYDDTDHVIVLLAKAYSEENAPDSAAKAILPLLKAGIRTEEVCEEVDRLTDQRKHTAELDEAITVCHRGG